MQDAGPVGHGEELRVVFRDANLAVIEAVRPLPEGNAPAEGVNDPGIGVAPGAEDVMAECRAVCSERSILVIEPYSPYTAFPCIRDQM